MFSTASESRNSMGVFLPQASPYSADHFLSPTAFLGTPRREDPESLDTPAKFGPLVEIVLAGAGAGGVGIPCSRSESFCLTSGPSSSFFTLEFRELFLLPTRSRDGAGSLRSADSKRSPSSISDSLSSPSARDCALYIEFSAGGKLSGTSYFGFCCRRFVTRGRSPMTPRTAFPFASTMPPSRVTRGKLVALTSYVRSPSLFFLLLPI